ncbi:UNVERIFIED_CONTAM: hypothetical protein Slati_4285700 [Sesamum latifolium]|uniref:MULE transposase domain-containing protein n=1 Tax=Sesamum latifolium TaxID=2727402 RepID=A0AAW2TEI0_9LAMI
MLFIRNARHVDMPPPQYHPDSDSITLSLHYNGVVRHVPEAMYVGGSVTKYDYVLAQEINIQTEWRKIKKKREMFIYVEVDGGKGPAETEVVGGGESEPFTFLGSEQIKGGDIPEVAEGVHGAAGGEVDEKGEVVHGAAGGEVDERGEGVHGSAGGEVEGDELVHSDYEEIEGEDGVQCAESGRVEGKNARDLDSSFRVDCINELRVNMSRQQAYRAKKVALKEIEGAPEWQYIVDYSEEIRRINPRSTVVVGAEDNMRESRFSRSYVCFGALKRGFKAGCRPIIGVDGCHLKGPHGGILLTAIGVDPNNNLFPIAYVVVDKECKETWEWFLIILKYDLEIIRNYEDTFMSEIFPGSDHRYCVRHLHNNFKVAGFRGLAYKNALWNAARACTANELAIEALEQVTEPAIKAQQATEPATNITEDEQPEACLTQDQMQPQAAPPLPVCMPGPSMFHQLQMTNPLSTLQQRVTIRAPPPFRGRQILPSFSTRPHSGTSQPIVKDGREKFLKLNHKNGS